MNDLNLDFFPESFPLGKIETKPEQNIVAIFASTILEKT